MALRIDQLPHANCNCHGPMRWQLYSQIGVLFLSGILASVCPEMALANICEDAVSPKSAKTRGTDIADLVRTFLTKTMAVHATDVFPSDGIVRPHRFSTVHFALGGLVPDQGLKSWVPSSWQDKKYFIVVPTQDVLQGALNFFAQDTAYPGPFILPPGSVILARERTPQDSGLEVVEIGNEAGRAKISEILERRGFLAVKMAQGTGIAGDSAYFLGQNINASEFFQEIGKRFPQLRQEAAVQSALHRLEVRSSKYNSQFRTEQSIALLQRLHLRLKINVLRQLDALSLSVESRENVRRKVEEISKMVSRLRPTSHQVRRIDFGDDATKNLNAFLDQLDDPDSGDVLGILASDLEPAQLVSDLNVIPQKSQRDWVALNYGLYRLTRLDLSSAQVQTLLAFLEDLFHRQTPETRLGFARYARQYPIDNFLVGQDNTIVSRIDAFMLLPSTHASFSKVFKVQQPITVSEISRLMK